MNIMAVRTLNFQKCCTMSEFPISKSGTTYYMHTFVIVSGSDGQG